MDRPDRLFRTCLSGDCGSAEPGLERAIALPGPGPRERSTRTDVLSLERPQESEVHRQLLYRQLPTQVQEQYGRIHRPRPVACYMHDCGDFCHNHRSIHSEVLQDPLARADHLPRTANYVFLST